MRSLSIFLACVAALQAASTLRVHGQATVLAEPDQVQFDIGVVTPAETAKAATDRNATQSNALVQALRDLVPAGAIKSLNFSVNPNYRYPQQGAPTIAGYTASNTVRLLLNDISKLQKIIEIAANSGANSVNRLAFTLQNERPVRAQALAEAAAQAKAAAEALASSLKLKLGHLLSVEEGQPVIVSPPREISFEKLQSTGVSPISPGTINVHADVDLTFEIVETLAN
jgi:uncharacterized protein YggE